LLALKANCITNITENDKGRYCKKYIRSDWS
jgi:hypothetical protein